MAGLSENPWKIDKRNSTPAGVEDALIRRAICFAPAGAIRERVGFHGFTRSAAWPPLDRSTRGYP
jgi:hypothetical protein